MGRPAREDDHSCTSSPHALAGTAAHDSAPCRPHCVRIPDTTPVSSPSIKTLPLCTKLAGQALMRNVMPLVVLVALLLSAHDARACSCIRGLPLCRDFASARSIFVGVAGPTRQDLTAERNVTTFRVSRMLHGKSRGASLVINSDFNCGYRFQPGQEYVVYASGDSDAELWTGLCSGTHLLSDGNQELTYQVKQPVPGLILVEGTVLYTRDTRVIPRTLVRVVDTEYSASVDAQGGFRLDLPPGRYVLRAEADGMRSVKEETLTLAAGSPCVGATLRLETNGRIRGTVRHADGSPAANVVVRAHGDINTGIDPTARTDASGRYELEGILATKYRVELESRGIVPRIFYPGTFRESEAKRVEVARAGTVDHVDIVEPALPRTRSIVVRARDTDGNPIAGAHVKFYMGSYGRPDEVCDATGRAELAAFEGLMTSFQVCRPNTHVCSDMKFVQAESAPIDVTVRTLPR